MRLLAMMARYRRWAALVVLLQITLLALQISGLNLLGLGIELVAQQSGLARGAVPAALPGGMNLPASPRAALAVVASAMVAVVLVRSVLGYASALAASYLVQGQLVVDLRSDLYAQYQRLGPKFYRAQTTGALINRVTKDSQAVALFLEGVLLQVIQLVLALVVFVSYMLSIHVGLTIACLATTPALWALAIRFSRTVRPAYDRHRDLLDHLVFDLTENIRGVAVVKGFGCEERQTGRFAIANRAVTDQQRWIFWRVSLFTPTVEMLTQCNLVVLLCYGGYLVMQGELALGTGLVVFSGLLQQVSSQVSRVANVTNSIQQSLAGARRVFDVLDTQPEVASPLEPRPLPRATGDLRFEQVTFCYDELQPSGAQTSEPQSRDRAALRDVDLHVRPGQRVAIVGTTGSGKSTLLALVARFYDPTHGRVLLDGIDLRQLDLSELRRQVGLVPQESLLFTGTVAENIAFGCPEASREQIARAAQLAAADEFIADLPDGYDTLLGESGRQLSGGQRQRLALARALLVDPPVLLLDDPTSAVDPETEHEILAALQDNLAGRTVLIVAHRLSTLRQADWIVVLEAGQIVQQGTHDDLFRHDGPYRDAAVLQSEDETPWALAQAS